MGIDSRTDWLVSVVKSWQVAIAGGMATMIGFAIRRHVSRVDKLAEKIDQHAADEQEWREKDRDATKEDFRHVHERLDTINERLAGLTSCK